MKTQTPAQLGVCSWSLHPKDPADLAQQVRQIGLKQVQLALNPLSDQPAVWGDAAAALAKHGIAVGSGMFSCVGEDYATLESIRRTGGVIRDETWPRNEAIAHQAAAAAATLGLTMVSTHAGFLPEDASDPRFEKLVRRIAALAGILGQHGQTLLFETGQEDADTLLRFLEALRAAGAANIGVNFDPANMILYGKGEPVASLRKLVAHVRQVHGKDAVATQQPGTWGCEVAVGSGQVNWRAFMQVLADADFAGPIMIEREAGQQRIADIRGAVAVLSAAMS
jgi:sugar phosphate isomerase/epimerase